MDALPDPIAQLATNAIAGQFAAGEASDAKDLVKAVEKLIDDGCFRAAAGLARNAACYHPQTDYFSSMLVALNAVPLVSDIAFDTFVDDINKDVQIVPRAGATALLIAFCANDRATLPLKLIHRWFGRLDVHVVYLRDRHRGLYLKGIQSLGDLEQSAAALRIISHELGAERIFCYGGSKGGYGALTYGALLRAEAVLAFGPPTIIDDDVRARFVLPAGIEVDLRRRYAQDAPRAHVVFAGASVPERTHAEYLKGLPTLSLEGVQGVTRHGIALDLIRLQRLTPLLAGLVDPTKRMQTWSLAGAFPTEIDLSGLPASAG